MAPDEARLAPTPEPNPAATHAQPEPAIPTDAATPAALPLAGVVEGAAADPSATNAAIPADLPPAVAVEGAAAEPPAADLGQIERDLAAVDQALVRLDDGTYGACQVCGEPLDDAALASDPTTLVCDRHLDVVRP